MATFLMVTSFSVAQKKETRADVLFFEYNFKEAISEYLKEMREQPLTNQQTLNLADSYLKTGNYDKATDTYLEVYNSDDVMPGYYFNRMLQAMSQKVGRDSTKAFLDKKSRGLSAMFLENATFNYDVLQRNDTTGVDYKIFNVTSNSPQSDFAPTFYKDQVLFTSARPQESKKIYNPSGESYLDIFSATLEAQGDLGAVAPYKGIP